ncbi:MAG TPA: hypothetical protein VF268_01775 [Gammaproteobacteria bacterium]
MYKQIFIFTSVLVMLIVGGARLYSRNTEISREIASITRECEQKAAELEAGFQSEIDDLRQYIMAYYKKDAEAKPEERRRFDQLASHGHRVRAISQKYDFLLETALISETEKKQLLKLLLERERLVNLIEIAEKESGSDLNLQRLQTDLDNVESQIQVLLQDPLDYQRYEVLRQREL